jgi:cytochrome c biogenesis protein CcmG/thiol:disulfide interchange protein DsbE
MPDMTDHPANADPRMPEEIIPTRGMLRRRLLFAAPVFGFAGMAVLLGASLGGDPGKLPSTLIGKPAPTFDLPAVQGRKLGLSSDDLRGQVSLVNVFASWCVACRAEHPLLLRLAVEKIVPIYGLNYKDEPADAARWLDAMGDPYTRTGSDRTGRVAIDWGVYGVPETFVVGADGRIARKFIGPLTERDIGETILPLVARLRRVAQGGRP